MVPRREQEASMYSQTRQAFVTAGFPAQQITMLAGIDVRASGKAGLAPAVAPHQVAMYAFQHMFLPRATRLFRNDPELKFVFFVEDDTRCNADVDADVIWTECMKFFPSAVRLGWLTKTHKNWGAHCIVFTRRACDAFSDMCRQALNPDKPLQGLMGLDTYFAQVRDQREKIDGNLLLRDSRRNLVVQHKHGLQGRW